MHRKGCDCHMAPRDYRVSDQLSGGRKLIAYSTYNNESTKVQNPRRMYGLASDGAMTMQMMIPKCNCIEYAINY